MKIGDEIQFGKYDWIVLEVDKEKALIITKYIIAQMQYHNKYCDVTWNECFLRHYLNSNFLNHFNENEKEQIIKVKNKNIDNNWYGTLGGVDTEDFIFLLSLEETCKYFGDSSQLLFHKGNNQRYWFERKDLNNAKRIATLVDRNEQVWWWWTRTPGRKSIKAVYIHGDGNIGIQGNNVLKGNISDGKCTGGVRPALWIKVK